MRVLLDSDVFFWWVVDSSKLSRTAWATIDDDLTEVFISSVVAWEITNKVRSGKWPEARPLAESFFGTVKHYGFEPLPLTLEHAHYAGTFPAAHRDPFDRMLAAQTLIEGVQLVPPTRPFDRLGSKFSGDFRVSGNPDPKHVSTSYAERQNLTMRMHMRRFTRLTNASPRRSRTIRQRCRCTRCSTIS